MFNWSNEIFDGDIVIKYLLIQLNFFLGVHTRSRYPHTFKILWQFVCISALHIISRGFKSTIHVNFSVTIENINLTRTYATLFRMSANMCEIILYCVIYLYIIDIIYLIIIM